MSSLSSFFHAYDLRGTYPDEIGEEEAKKVGKAYGTFINADRVLVGRDGRTHAEKITNSFIEGVLSTGTDVSYGGVVPSPVVYFGQVKNNFKSSAVVTASHNPPKYTGFKFNLEEAKAMSREGGMEKIQEIYESEDFETGEGETVEIELKKDYVEALKHKFGEVDISLVINCGNGVTGVIARKLFKKIASNVKLVNERVDGNFPNHLADPGDQEARKATKEAMEDHDLGIIFDGDGDRAGFIVPEYGYVEEDKVMALFAEKCLQKTEGKVVYDIRASKLVSEKVEEYGGIPIESKVGHTFISEKIHEGNASFAGELSGHFYFPAFDFPWDDGLFAAVLMSNICSSEDLDEKLNLMPDYPVSPELRIDCPEEAKQKVIKQVSEEYSNRETSNKDGIKIKFDNGWALVRPSNTEPKMSLRCEADTQEYLNDISNEVESKVREAIEASS